MDYLRHRLYLSLSLFWPLLLNPYLSLALSASFEEAAQLYEAGYYQPAHSAYLQLVQEANSRWEQMTAFYNSALSLLSDQQLTKARQLLHTLLSIPSLPPLLRREALRASLLARLNEAAKLLEGKNRGAALAQTSEALVLLRGSHKLLLELAQAQAALQQAKGLVKADAAPSPWLVAMEQQLTAQLLRAKELQQKALLHPSTLRELFWHIELGLLSSQEDRLSTLSWLWEKLFALLYPTEDKGRDTLFLYQLSDQLFFSLLLDPLLLQRLIERQERQLALLSSQPDKTLLELSIKATQQAKEAAASGDLDAAHFLLAVARYYLQQLSFASLSLPPATNAGAALAQIIERERLLLRLSQLLELTSYRPLFGWQALSSLQQLQLTQLLHFEGLLQQQQKELYAQGHCLRLPWDQLIPLYQKGKMAARRVLDRLERRGGLTKIMEDREISLSAWEESLRLWQTPLPPSTSEADSSCFGGGGAAASSSSAAERLRQLKEMELDDRIERKRQVVKTEGKPW